ncbi:MAG: protein kinase [Myxococcales bacterium]|nr:protein kinase [Myxococcales bacterium]
MLDQQTARDRVGTVLDDKYRLEKLLGLGGMGAVYRGVHQWTERPVAVKLLFDDVSKNEESVERFFREARALSRVGHKGIVQVLDLGRTSDDTLYLVQELLDGETLRAHMNRAGKLSITECARIVLPVLDALDAAHAAGMIHRDVKPENIVLHREPRGSVEPKLIDFGVARLDVQGIRLTRAGSLLGTPHYMAPEQVRGELDTDARADLWSLGVVLFECTSGQRPYSADNIRELFAKVTLEPVPSLGAVEPSLPEAFVRVVDRALAKEPSRRWPSARAMLIEFACVPEVRKDPALAATFAALGLDAPSNKTAIAGSAFVSAALPTEAQPPRPVAPSMMKTSEVAPAPSPSPAPPPAPPLASPTRTPSPTAPSRTALVSPPPATAERAKPDPKLGRVALAVSLTSAVLVVASYTLRPTREATLPATNTAQTTQPAVTTDSGVAVINAADASAARVAHTPDVALEPAHTINAAPAVTDAGRAAPRRQRPTNPSLRNGFID